MVAQFALPAIALFGGVKLLMTNLRRDVRVVLAKRARGHVIVCGLGETGRSVVTGLAEAKRGVVAITLSPDDPNTLACEQMGVPVLSGDAAQASVLALAGLRHADAVVMTTDRTRSTFEIGLRAGESLAEFRRGDAVQPCPKCAATGCATSWLGTAPPCWAAPRPRCSCSIST